MSIPAWKSVVYGLFIGTSVSSTVLFVFRIIPISTLGMIIILYLYAIVGGITGFVIHRKFEGNSTNNNENPEGNQVRDINHQNISDSKNNNSQNQPQAEGYSKKANEPSKKTENSNNPEKDVVEIKNYKEKLDDIKNLKRMSLIIKGLVKTREKIDSLRQESNLILEDTVKIMDDKTMNINRDYLKTN